MFTTDPLYFRGRSVINLISKTEKVLSDIRRAQSGQITTSSEKDWSQQVEHMQVQKGPGVRRS